MDQLNLKFLVRLSIVPKFDQDQIQFKFIDMKMKNELIVRALPEIEIILAIPAAYPSNQRPLFLQTSMFYTDKYNQFIIDKINEKWTEDMPILYEIVTFI